MEGRQWIPSSNQTREWKRTERCGKWLESPQVWDFSFKWRFFGFFLFLSHIQHCFICRPSDSTVSEDAVIEPRTIVTTALVVRRSNYSARSHPQVWDFSSLRFSTFLYHKASMDWWLWDWNKKFKILLFGENFVFAHAECALKKIICVL